MIIHVGIYIYQHKYICMCHCILRLYFSLSTRQNSEEDTKKLLRLYFTPLRQ